MKLISEISDVPELTNSNVYIKDCEYLLQKINKIIRDGHQKLQIVTDFDHTLTRHEMENGTIVPSSFGMFRECPSVPQRYRDEDTRLCDIYRPIEVDSVMSVEDKTKHMVDWYVAAHALLKGLRFPKEELLGVSKKMVECFRSGVKELIAWSQKKQVPVLVFSAGLGESVVAALSSADLLLPHVKVVSNFLSIDDSGTIDGIKGEIIHTYNKNETAIKDTDYYEMVRERSNVLLIGDNIGDAGMAEGMAHCDVIIKIGFLGRNVDANLQNYLDMFDIVVVKDHTVDVVNAILKLVL